MTKYYLQEWGNKYEVSKKEFYWNKFITYVFNFVIIGLVVSYIGIIIDILK